MEKDIADLVVIDFFDLNQSGTKDTRLARIGERWYVYDFDGLTGRVEYGNEFAKHNASGVKYLFGNGHTEMDARNLFNRLKNRAKK